VGGGGAGGAGGGGEGKGVGVEERQGGSGRDFGGHLGGSCNRNGMLFQ